MDTKALISEAKARFSHNSAKAYLKDKYSNKLVIASQSGLWKITSEFIGVLSSFTEQTIVLLDQYENPILVNRIELLDKAKEVYNDVMQKWANEWAELEKYR